MKSLTSIFNKPVGRDHPCFMLAEIGNNHNGSVELAKTLIDAAADAGADAVKFQTFKAEDIVSPLIPANAYPGWDVSKKFDRWIDFVRTLELPYDSYDELIAHTHKRGLAFVSTPASFDALDFLLSKKIDAIKIASMDMNNIPFLQKVDAAGFPTILSTGMSLIEEIKESVGTFKNAPLAVLHCVSNYPLKYSEANLNNITTFLELFSIPVGFSNHAMGGDLDVAAVAMGARLIEKHITMNRADTKVAEHHMSMEPGEYKDMIARVRAIESAMGSRSRTLTKEESTNRALARRSVTVRHAMKAGDVIAEKDLVLIRPGTGLAPKHLPAVVGNQLVRPVDAFQTLTWDDLRVQAAENGALHSSGEKVTQNGFDVINCRTCRYWHVYPTPSGKQLQEYYESVYYQNAQEHGDMKDKNTDPDGYYRLKYEDKLANLESLLLPGMPKTILDIGAGYGEFLEFFQEHGWQVWGVEPAPHCIEKGRGAKCNIIQGDLDSLSKLNLPKVSVVAINTVLEHVPYPKELLVSLRDHLMDEKTILHVEVPNDFSLLQEGVNSVCSPRKYWVCPIGHLNYWTHQSFADFVDRLGFRIEAMESTMPLELLAMFGDDYISDPAKGRGMHLKRVDLEKRFAKANKSELKREIFKRFAKVGMGREILAYMRKS